MNKPLLATLVILNIPLYGLLASIFFGRDGIVEAIKYAFIPDLISALRGEYWDDKWSELMLLIWFVFCAMLVLSEYNYIEKNSPSVFSFFVSLVTK